MTLRYVSVGLSQFNAYPKSISICEEYVSNSEFKDLFNKSSKKDDLADSYLQGLWYIKNKVLI